MHSHVQLFETPWTTQSMEFSRPEYWSGLPFPSAGDLPDLAIEPRSPTLQADSLPAEPPGKPKNTGVGSLSLFQWNFLIQESNQGLLQCRQILYQLSYQGSPRRQYSSAFPISGPGTRQRESTSIALMWFRTYFPKYVAFAY